MTGTIRDELLRLERALADRDPAGIDGDLVDLIADDFLEFGRSGTVWTRETIAPFLASGPAPVATTLEAFEAHAIGADVVLVTYRGQQALRSSIWIRRDGRWQMRFHQGTPLPSEPREATGPPPAG